MKRSITDIGLQKMVSEIMVNTRMTRTDLLYTVNGTLDHSGYERIKRKILFDLLNWMVDKNLLQSKQNGNGIMIVGIYEDDQTDKRVSRARG